MIISDVDVISDQGYDNDADKCSHEMIDDK
jgi:hypothetical protein